MINLNIFFPKVRQSVFHGSLTKGQVDGMERIIDYWETEWTAMPLDQFAYLLATVAHETAFKMRPVKEAGSPAYLRSKRYFPFIGVGLIQATWKRNWDILGIKSIEDGLQWPSALYAAFYGMDKGIYTGKSLHDYIRRDRRDYVNARRIINGTDRAHDIAKLADSFRIALIAAKTENAPQVAAYAAPLSAYGGSKASIYMDDFKANLIRLLEEDPEVRGVLLAVVFPDGQDHEEPNPLDEPYDEYGADQVVDSNEEPHELYGAA